MLEPIYIRGRPHLSRTQASALTGIPFSTLQYLELVRRLGAITIAGRKFVEAEGVAAYLRGRGRAVPDEIAALLSPKAA